MVSVSIAERIRQWSVIDECTSSDHRAIAISIQGRKPLVNSCTYNGTDPRYNTKKAKWHKFREELTKNATTISEDIDGTNKIDVWVKSITERIHKAADKSMPKKKQYRKSVPWWTQELTSSKKRAHRARKLWQAEQSPEAKEAKKQLYRVELRRYSSKVRAAKKQSWRQFVNKASSEDYYGILYKIFNDKMTPERAMSCISVEGTHTVDWKTTMETLMKALFGKSDDSNVRVTGTVAQTVTAWERWTMTDLRQAIKKTKKGKAPGQDKVEAEMFIEMTKGPVTSDLLDLFNECRRQGYFPTAWKDAKLVTLLKSADKDVTNPESYRPICLLSIISKTMERLINNSIKPVLLDQRYASDRQYGYREKPLPIYWQRTSS
ncbi:hypothetical protein TKK_0011631 [Trichogramma kaykai]|uniref:Reverse transcriptase domain-containing protein n=1 Tax=Trichogramma kaykai TaxID=54128 RepID=A0ABD2WQU2_9HYME